VESGRWESDETERNRREWSEMKRGLASDSRSMWKICTNKYELHFNAY